MANVTGDALASLDYRAELRGENSLAAGRLRKALEHARIAVGVFVIKDADGVDESARFLRDFQNVGQSVPAGVVPAVADDG